MTKSSISNSQVLSDCSPTPQTEALKPLGTAIYPRVPTHEENRLPGADGVVYQPKLELSEVNSFAAQTGLSNTVSAPASVVELARALRNNVDLLFYHVYNQVEYYPIWGAQKGALGTLLDGIGTSIDQCQLLVELLRQAGYTANYIIGDIDLSNDQLSAWLGTDSSDIANAVTLLDAGGIPHQAAYQSGGIWRLQLTHAWVKVTIGGTNYLLDPSLKTYTTTSGINLATATQYDQTTFLGNTSGTLAGASIDTVNGDWIQNANSANIRSNLSTYSTNLANWIKTFNKLWYATIGGTVTTGDVITITAYNSGITGGKKSVSYTAVGGDTPTSIATALKNGINGDTDLSSNGISATSSGAKITITTTSTNSTAFTSATNVGATETIDVSNPQATLDDILGGRQIVQINTPVRITSLSYQVGSPTEYSSIPTANRIKVTVKAQSGAINKDYYADDIYAKRLTVFYKDQFNGTYKPELRLDGNLEVTGNAVSTQVQVPFTLDFVHPNSAFNETGVVINTQSPYSGGIGAKYYLIGLGFGFCSKGTVEFFQRQAAERIAAGDLPESEFLLGTELSVMWRTYLAECSHVGDIAGRIMNCKLLYQHNAGSISKDTAASVGGFDLAPGTNASVSFTSLDGSSTNKSQFITSHSMHGHALEGISIQQTNGNFFGAGAYSYLRLGNLTATATVGGTITAGNQVTITVTDPALSTNPRSVTYTVQAGDTLNAVATGLKNAINADSVVSKIVKATTSTSTPTTVVLSSISANMTTFAKSTTGTITLTTPSTLKTYKGTSTSWSTRIYPNLKDYQSSSGTISAGIFSGVVLLPERAHLPFDTLTLEGWAYSQPSTGGSGGASGIILGSKGGLAPWNYQNPPQCECRKCEEEEADPVVLRTGAYRYRQTDLEVGSSVYPYKLDFGVEYDSQERFVDGPLGYGWRHNWQLSGGEVTRPFRAMGQESPIDAVATIVSIYVCRDLIADSAQPIEKVFSAWLTTAWWGDQITKNVALIETPDSTLDFTRLPDGSYNQPNGVASDLVKNSSGQLVMTSAQGDKYTYRSSDFKLDKIEFKFGVTITLTYNGTTGNLETIGNGLGRTLTLTYSGTPSRLASVSDGTSRLAQYTVSSGLLSAIKDPLLNDTTFQYDSTGRLQKYFLPQNPTSPMVTNAYDSLGKIASQLDMNNRWIARVESSKVTIGGTITIGDLLKISVRQPSLAGGQRTISYTVQSGDTTTTIATALKNAINADSNLALIGVSATSSSNVISISSPGYPAIYELSTNPTATETLTATATTGDVITITVSDAGLPGSHQKSVNYTVQAGDNTANIASGLIAAINADSSLAAIGVTASATTGGIGSYFTLSSTSSNPTSYASSTSGGATESVLLNSRTFYVAGWRTEYVNPYGSSAIYEFDNHDNIVKKADEAGNITTHVFDGLDREIRMTMPEGNATVWTYDAKHNVLTETQLAKPGSGLAKIERAFTYHATLNKVTSVRDALNQITSYSYNTDGTLATITRPVVDGLTPQIDMTYNSRGQMITRKERVDGNSANDITTKFDYDASTEKLTAVTQDYGTSPHLNLVTNLGYTTRGDISSIQDPRGNTTSFTFDEKRRLTQRTDPSPFSYLTKMTYDKNDNLTKVERQYAGGWQTFNATYNVANQIVSLSDPLNHSMSKQYDELRRLWKDTDAENRTKEMRYESRGKLSKVLEPNPLDPTKPVTTTFAYSNNGLKSSVADGRGNVTQMTVDGFDRPDKTIYPDASYEQNQSYDANGNVLTRRIRDSHTIVQTFDALNRLKTKAPFGQPTVTFYYDLGGRMTKASTPFSSGNPATGDFSFFFDSAGRFVKERYSDGVSITRDVTFTLDANGNITRLTYPDSYFIDRVYDELNRLTDIKLNGAGSSAAHFDYDELSRRTKLTYPLNGTSIDYSYQLDDTMSGLLASFAGGANAFFGYSFNNAKQLIRQTVSDPANYEWHPAGGGTTSYSANNLNEYSSVGGTSFSYNSNGCLTSDGTWTFGYDSENHLLSATNGATTANFVYDPMHRQIQKSIAGGAKTLYVYSGWQRFADYDGSMSTPTVLQRYVYGTSLDEILLQVTGTSPSFTVSYFYQDRLGNVVAKADSSGTVTNRYKYSPWGESPSLTGTTHGFTGQRFDPETGLCFFKHRYYSQKLGRFLQPDPIKRRVKFGISAMSYASEDPFRFCDPFGLNNALLQKPPVGVGVGVGAGRPGFPGGPLGIAITIWGTVIFITWQQMQRIIKLWEEIHEMEESLADKEFGDCMKGADEEFDEEEDKLRKKFAKCPKTPQMDDAYGEELNRLKRQRDQKRSDCRTARSNWPFTPHPFSADKPVIFGDQESADFWQQLLGGDDNE